MEPYMFVFTHRPHRKSLEVQDVQGYSPAVLSDVTLPYLRHPEQVADDRATGFVERAIGRGWLSPQKELNGVLRIVKAEPWLRRMQIETALTCNFSCDYCYSGSAPTRRERLAPAEIVALLDQAADLAVREICFTGGEFLLYPSWRDLVAHARSHDMIVDIHTNGYLLDDGAIAHITQSKVRQVQVTMESHLAEIHESIRGRKGSWSRVMRNIKAARDAGLRTKVVTQVHRKNLSTIRETAKWFHNELGQMVNLDRIVGGGDDFAVSHEEFWEAVAPLMGLGARASRLCDPADAGIPGVEPECGVGADLVYVTADGEIALCPTMTSRESALFSGPNLRETSLEDAWYSSQVFTRYRGVNCENTHQCPAAGSCRGGCRSNAYAETGRVEAPDVIACNINKNPGGVFVDFIGRYADGDFTPVTV
ncbi:radical SAM protein [Nonomuraea zeae]|uniref:Radical SAM protein n=2 Tax=Nonomuraea zeae TaxID=1642303 RepID=A0A5S4FVE1_9ACTN|nr:radical SAM protein [Nonomuraea zeae]